EGQGPSIPHKWPAVEGGQEPAIDAHGRGILDRGELIHWGAGVGQGLHRALQHGGRNPMFAPLTRDTRGIVTRTRPIDAVLAVGLALALHYRTVLGEHHATAEHNLHGPLDASMHGLG